MAFGVSRTPGSAGQCRSGASLPSLFCFPPFHGTLARDLKARASRSLAWRCGWAGRRGGLLTPWTPRRQRRPKVTTSRRAPRARRGPVRRTGRRPGQAALGRAQWHEPTRNSFHNFWPCRWAGPGWPGWPGRWAGGVAGGCRGLPSGRRGRLREQGELSWPAGVGLRRSSWRAQGERDGIAAPRPHVHVPLPGCVPAL